MGWKKFQPRPQNWMLVPLSNKHPHPFHVEVSLWDPSISADAWFSRSSCDDLLDLDTMALQRKYNCRICTFFWLRKHFALATWNSSPSTSNSPGEPCDGYNVIMIVFYFVTDSIFSSVWFGGAGLSQWRRPDCCQTQILVTNPFIFHL